MSRQHKDTNQTGSSTYKPLHELLHKPNVKVSTIELVVTPQYFQPHFGTFKPARFVEMQVHLSPTSEDFRLASQGAVL